MYGIVLCSPLQNDQRLAGAGLLIQYFLKQVLIYSTYALFTIV